MKKKKNLNKIALRALTIIVSLASFLVVCYYLFNLFVGEGKLVADFQKWANESPALAYCLFLFLSPLINIVPGISSIFFLTLGNLLFNDKTPWGMSRTFLICSASVLLTSSIMFIIGRFGGKKAVEWIIGKESSDKAKRLLTLGGKAALPMMYLLPFFPDDTLSLVAGMTEMKFSYNFICTLIFRNIGVLTICVLGTDFLDYKHFTPLMWVGFIAVILVLFLICSLLSYLYYRYLRYKEEGRHYLLTQSLNIVK
jgi:uncharacterized membrane protein YdjX (TVP38/TMEM64 family)